MYDKIHYNIKNKKLKKKKKTLQRYTGFWHDHENLAWSPTWNIQTATQDYLQTHSLKQSPHQPEEPWEEITVEQATEFWGVACGAFVVTAN